MSSLDELDRLADLLAHPEDLLPDIAAEAAPEVQRVARGEYAQGIGPAGAHAPRKKDGALALQRPLSTVTFAGVGATIAGSAEEVLRYHQKVFTAPFPERKTFPDDDGPIPNTWENAIERKAEKIFEKTFGGLR